MATNVLFISVKDIKQSGIFDGNIDSDKIIPYILIAQDTHIQNYLGGTLYEKLKDLVLDGSIDDVANSDYKTLLTYIKPMLKWYTQATYLPYSAYQISNGGVFKHRSENSDTVTKEELDSLVQDTRSKAEFYTKRYLDFICDNSSLYPEYNNNDSDKMNPDRDVNYSGGWYI